MKLGVRNIFKMQVQELCYINYHVCLPHFLNNPGHEFFKVVFGKCNWYNWSECNRYNWSELSRWLNWIRFLLCRKQNALLGGSWVCSLRKILISRSCDIHHPGHFWVTRFSLTRNNVRISSKTPIFHLSPQFKNLMVN